MDRTPTRELYRISLPHGRSAEISAEQIRSIARGLGEEGSREHDTGRTPAVVEALEALPVEQRADALAVASRRFGDKQDVESIAHACELTAWRVWQLEEAFRQALDRVARGSANGESLNRQLGESTAARLMSEDLLANAIAHGEQVDLDAEHEASLQAAREIRS